MKQCALSCIFFFHDVVRGGGHTGFFPGGSEIFSKSKTPTFSFHDVVRGGGGGSHRFLFQSGSTCP